MQRRVTPQEGSPGSLYCLVHIFLVSFSYLTEDFSGGWIDGGECFLADSIVPLIVYEDLVVEDFRLLVGAQAGQACRTEANAMCWAYCYFLPFLFVFLT